MESLPLKELDFGLRKPTGPSSGVVASILLVSPGLDCPGVSLAEVCATCLRCHLWQGHSCAMSRNYIFTTLKNIYKIYGSPSSNIRKLISCSTMIYIEFLILTIIGLATKDQKVKFFKIFKNL